MGWIEGVMSNLTDIIMAMEKLDLLVMNISLTRMQGNDKSREILLPHVGWRLTCACKVDQASNYYCCQELSAVVEHLAPEVCDRELPG